jgi:hypothetical protein
VVLLLVDDGEDVDDRFAIGRDARVGDEFEGKIILGGDAALRLTASHMRSNETKYEEA